MIQLDLTEEELQSILESVEDREIAHDEAFDQIMLFQSKNRIRDNRGDE